MSDKSKNRFSRRRFLEVSTVAGLGIGAGCATTQDPPMQTAAVTAPDIKRPQLAALHGPGRATANEKITIGVIGCAGRGSHDMEWFMRNEDVQIGAVCDVYQPHLDAAVQKAGGNAKPYHDFRELLDQKDLDAVIITTPPHWHPLMFIHACQAGKDVYCEKPMCFTPAEGRAMINAARMNNRVSQIGTQIHAEENYRRVVEIVRSGILGKISMVHNVLSLNEAPSFLGNAPFTDPPPDLDWDMWCGPAPKINYHQKYFEGGQHRYVKELIGSWIHEMGPHIVDLPVWALELGAPKSVTACGGRYATTDVSTIPDTVHVTWDYGDLMMTWTNQCANSHGLQFHGGKGITRRLGVSFHGVDGTCTADYNRREVIAEGERLDESQLPAPSLPASPGHDREFLNSVKSRELPSCDVEYHYRVHLALNLGNLSMQLGRTLHWDAENEQIIGDPEANAMLVPDYRAPWVLPV